MQIELEANLETQKILIAGLDNAGKSSIQDILRFLPTEAALRRTPSQDIEIFQKKFLKRDYIFFIPPGQENIRMKEYHGTMKEEYFSNICTFIFVIDSTDKSRFQEVLHELEHSIQDLLDLSPDCRQLLIFAHKQDLTEACNGMTIKKEILEPLECRYPELINRFKIYETTIISPETIHEPFLKAIAKHVGTIRVDFDRLAEWIREQTLAKLVLITDANGLLIGESFTGTENSAAFAAFVAKIFSATDNFHEELIIDGIKIVVLEEENEKSFSLISRINCTMKDYLTLFIGNPVVQLGMARLINKKGLEKLKIAFQNYQG